MPKTKITPFILLVFIFTSCHNSGSKNAKKQVKEDLAKMQAQPATQFVPGTDRDDGYISSFEDTAITPGRIHRDLFIFHPAFISGKFNLESALMKLYPGNFYKLWESEKDSTVLEAWNCPACTKHHFPGSVGINGDTIATFPLRDSNETVVSDTLMFNENGKRSILVSFNTTDYVVDFLRCGRFSNGFMGLALFTEENNGWKLEAFNPCIGCYGMFQQIPKIQPVVYGNGNVGCYFGDYIGGPGGPYSSSAYEVAVIGHDFKIVLNRNYVLRSDRPRNTWDTYQLIDSTQTDKLFRDIIFITQGDFYSKGYDTTSDYDTCEAPDEIWPITKKKDNFDYVIKARYSFQNGTYKIVSDSVTTTPHVVTNEEKHFKYSY